jgi:hypothetical protein
MKAGLVLGDRRPVDAVLLKEVLDSLLAPSTTVTSPIVPRVTPYDPTKSFLLDKITGNQNERGYAECRNQGPIGSSPDGCGDPMPLGNASYCATNADKVMTIAKWIRDGALGN